MLRSMQAGKLLELQQLSDTLVLSLGVEERSVSLLWLSWLRNLHVESESHVAMMAL